MVLLDIEQVDHTLGLLLARLFVSEWVRDSCGQSTMTCETTDDGTEVSRPCLRRRCAVWVGLLRATYGCGVHCAIMVAWSDQSRGHEGPHVASAARNGNAHLSVQKGALNRALPLCATPPSSI
jgi:hypothetical protein